MYEYGTLQAKFKAADQILPCRQGQHFPALEQPKAREHIPFLQVGARAMLYR